MTVYIRITDSAFQTDEYTIECVEKNAFETVNKLLHEMILREQIKLYLLRYEE